MSSVAIAVLAAQAGAASVPPPRPPAPSPVAFIAAPGASASTPSRQQAFDAAAAAADRREWDDALRRFEALEAQLGRGKATRSLALVRLRKGEALLGLGRTTEAEASVRTGLAALGRDAGFREDRLFAQLILAELAERRFDYKAAYGEFAATHADAAGTDFAGRALMGKLRSQTFVDARGAADAAQAGIADVAANDPASRETRANLRTLKGRALLNAGDFAGASAELQRANRELGGLTLRVTYADLVTRSDLALAALLAGKPEEARKYLAYTGAGRFADGYLPGPSIGRSPSCGGDAGLRPDDVAVVELALRDNGSVALATPIYASRSGIAPAFAATASRWTWNAEAIAKVPALVKLVTRVELRCRQAREYPSSMEYLAAEHDRWASPPVSVSGKPADTLPLAELRTRLSGAAPSALATRLGLWKAILDHPLSGRPEAGGATASALAAARDGAAPPMIRAYWALRQALLETSDPKLKPETQADRFAQAMDAIARDPVIAGDPRARAGVALIAADTLPFEREKKKVEPLLRRIVDDGALRPDDDLKVGAGLRLAKLMSIDGKHDEARRIYEGLGLTADRCPTLDTSRAIVRLNAGPSDFPMEAARWGFEGWSETEVLIGVDGRATGARTVTAYPPFVFGPAGERISTTSRYQPSFRPRSEAACGGQLQRVRFMLPS